MWKIVIKCKHCGCIDSWKNDGLCKNCGCKVAYNSFFRYDAPPTEYGELISAKRKYILWGKWIESGFYFTSKTRRCNKCD